MIQVPHHPRDPLGWCAGIALAFLALLLFRLGIPSRPYFDEIHYLPAARGLLNGTDWLNREHPMLGKELLAAGIGLFGDHQLRPDTVGRQRDPQRVRHAHDRRVVAR